MSDEKKKSDLIDAFGLWEMPSGKGYSGSMGGIRVVVFKNDRKKNPKEPDLRGYFTKNEKREQAREPGADDEPLF